MYFSADVHTSVPFLCGIKLSLSAAVLFELVDTFFSVGSILKKLKKSQLNCWGKSGEMGRLQKMLHVGAKMPGCCFLMIRISSVCKLQLVLSVPTSWNFSVLSAFCYANESSLFWTPCVIVPLLCTVYAL